MLEIENLGKRYGRDENERWALKNVQLTVEAGEFISIIGRSGSGKSTLLNLIAGLLKPTEGEIYFQGNAILNLNDKDASQLRNTKIGYVMQGNGALDHLTVLENLCLPFWLFPRKGEPRKRAEQLLKQVGLLEYADTYPKKLSGGELKRVAIARALMNEPALLLADEPTGDLDESNTKNILALFRDIADQGTCVLMVTHEMDALSYGDKVYRMEAGQLIK